MRPSDIGDTGDTDQRFWLFWPATIQERNWQLTFMSNTINKTASASTLKALVNLTPNQVYTAQPADTGIAGAMGSTVVLPDTANVVSLSGSIANLNLSQSIFNYSFMPNGWGGAYLYTNSGHILANISSSTSGMRVIFGDHSALTLSTNANGVQQIHYDQVQLTPNYILSVPNSNITVLGSSGNEAVTIPLGVNQVTLDANVETVTLKSFNFDPSLLKSNGSTINVTDSQGNSVLKWTANASGVETLNFNNAIGSIGLNALGQAQFSLKDLLLSLGQNYTLSQSGVSIYGNTGIESVTLVSGDRNETIDANVEKVILPGLVSNYSWSTQSGNITVFDATHNLVATIGVGRASSGTTLSFSDQTLNAQLSNAGIVVHNAAGQVVQSGGLVSGGSTTPTASSSPISPNASSSATTTIATSATSASNVPTSSAHFAYTLDWTSFSAYSSSVQASIQSCLTKALNNIGQFFNAKGSLDIQVIPENTNKTVLAEASGALVPVSSSIASTAHGASQTTDFLLESQTGTDANGAQADATVYINMANLSQFNLNPSVLPSSSQYDLTTILTHEMFHALGFDGTIGSSTKQMTSYDTYVVTKNGTPYFTGPSAESVYGGPVPLAPVSAGSGSAYYHVGVASDLMSDSISAGQVKTVSKLDLAILQDLGAPVLVGVAT